jgi:hypothetical protein
MDDIALEPTGGRDFEPCECCGRNSRTLWGLARRHGDAHASYFVHWTLGRVAEHGTHFDLIFGRWGEKTTRADRYAIALEYRRTDQRPAFMVIDASKRPFAQNELVGRALRREEVIGTTFAAEAFELVDAIWLHDSRISEVSGYAV